MRTIVAGNWKMHNDAKGSRALVEHVLELVPVGASTVEVVVAPPFPFLAQVVEQTRGSRVNVAAQNCHAAGQGAYTGEVSAGMLASIGVSYCLVGHSERRQYFGETDALVAKKISALLKEGIVPIYCCGENLAERESERHFDVVAEQMKTALGGLDIASLERVVIAYEPVWAIGTGLTATAAQAQDMHAHIRAMLRTHGAAVAAAVPILYGGSCKPDNAAAIFSCPDVNGGLIGGAALVAEQFAELIRIAERTKHL